MTHRVPCQAKPRLARPSLASPLSIIVSASLFITHRVPCLARPSQALPCPAWLLPTCFITLTHRVPCLARPSLASPCHAGPATLEVGLAFDCGEFPLAIAYCVRLWPTV